MQEPASDSEDEYGRDHGKFILSNSNTVCECLL